MRGKRRFAVGEKLRVKRPGVNGVVTQVDDEPTALGEYWHTIQTERLERREPGCNLELLPRPLSSSGRNATNPTQVINLRGDNCRVNLNSADNSSNATSVSNPQTERQYLQAEADKKVFRDFMEVVPSNGSISFLRRTFAAFSFERKRLDDLRTFIYERDGPDNEFLDLDLEAARNSFRESCRSLLDALGPNLFVTEPGWVSVPADWEIDNPDHFYQVVNEIHEAACAVCGSYDALVRLARKKLAV